jgi:hypothetical protein
VLVDLEYALRSNDTLSEATNLSVWLTADAPQSLVAALADHGVTVRGEQSAAVRAGDLASFGPGLDLLYEYFAAVVVLLLAAGVAVVGSTVESGGRVTELVALRAQGLSARGMRVAGVAGMAFLAATATLTGVLAALLANAVVTGGLPVFSDGWALLPVPPGLTPTTLGVSTGVVVLVLGVSSLWGAARLVATVRTRTGAKGAAS